MFTVSFRFFWQIKSWFWKSKLQAEILCCCFQPRLSALMDWLTSMMKWWLQCVFGHSILRNSGPSACTPGKVRGIFMQSLQPSVMAYVSAINAAQVAQDKDFDSQSTRGHIHNVRFTIRNSHENIRRLKMDWTTALIYVESLASVAILKIRWMTCGWTDLFNHANRCRVFCPRKMDHWNLDTRSLDNFYSYWVSWTRQLGQITCQMQADSKHRVWDLAFFLQRSESMRWTCDNWYNIYVIHRFLLPTTAWRKLLMSRWVSLSFQHFRGSAGPFSCDFLQVMTAAAETATAQVPCDQLLYGSLD